MIQIQVTTADKQEALKIADHLVSEKLAACAQVVGPIVSTYRWQGKVEVADEWLVLRPGRNFVQFSLKVVLERTPDKGEVDRSSRSRPTTTEVRQHIDIRLQSR